MPLLFLRRAIAEEVYVPLYHVSSVGKLLIDAFLAKGITSLVILWVADIVNGIIGVIVGQLLILIHVVNSLAIWLVFQFLRQVFVSYQFINDSFEYDMKTLH